MKPGPMQPYLSPRFRLDLGIAFDALLFEVGTVLYCICAPPAWAAAQQSLAHGIVPTVDTPVACPSQHRPMPCCASWLLGRAARGSR